jgi:pimeloyl-ACP methyl ester carboxylesterase
MDIKFLTLALLFGASLCAPPGGYPLKRTEYRFTVPLDHFDSNGNSPTFTIRYLADAQYWDPMNGPILFYAGNEGKIEGFWDNTGFITNELAPQLNGLIIYAEHRYFGESFPFDKNVSFDPQHNKWLTVDQTMMDYNLLIKEIRYIYGATDKPCFVFGGSYGGMLASWLRMKYPQTFQGAHASSAPILYFKDAGFPESSFGKIITDDYKKADPKCPGFISEAWGYLMDIRDKRQGDWSEVSTIFKTCKPIATKDDINNLYNHFMNGYSYMAMTDYPYETSFLQPMPPNPVEESCKAFKTIPPKKDKEETPTNGLSDREKLIFNALLQSTNVYFNY